MKIQWDRTLAGLGQRWLSRIPWFISVACGLLLGTPYGNAVTVKVDSTKQWLGWVNALQLNGAWVSGQPWNLADLPATFVPADSPSGSAPYGHLVLRPNTNTYNPNDPFWNFPDGSPSKLVEANFYVDVWTEYAGQTVTFQGSVVSNNIPRLAGSPTTGWEVIAFIKEFTTDSYGWVGMTSQSLSASGSFSVSRAIGPGRVCQYGFWVKGPNTAPGSANALTGVGILAVGPDPLITVHPISSTVGRGTTVNLTVTAVGGSALSYQWMHGVTILTNGGNISGANTSSLTISNAQFSDSGGYAVTVSNAAGSATSEWALLTVACAMGDEVVPFFIKSLAIQTNGSVTVAWDGCDDLIYQVQSSEGLSASNGWTPLALIFRSENPTTWTSSNTPAANARFYRVQGFTTYGDYDGDAFGNLDEFDSGTDLRNPDTDGDRLPDGWEFASGLNPLVATDAYTDSDSDGYTSLQEYQFHTNPNASYSQPAYLPRDLVGWWKFDEGASTNIFDSSLNGNDGYLLGTDPSGAWTTGYLSNGVTLGGSANRWVQVPYRARLAAAQEFTVMGWVKPSRQGILIGNLNSAGQASGNYELRFGPEDIELRFSPSGNGSYSTLQFNPNWSTNDWHHIAVRYGQGTNVAVFMDGVWRAGQAVLGPYQPVANPIRIGFPGLTNAFVVDDVRLYDRALTTNEIASLSQGSGLPLDMIVGQAARLRAFGASEGDSCQWSVISGRGFITNTVNCTAEFRPSWSGTATVQVVWAKAGVFHTNVSSTTVTFPSLSPLSDWNDGGVVQLLNNCYNFATDIRTYTRAQPGGPPYYYAYTCDLQTSAVLSDGLQAGVDLGDLCHTSGLPGGHIIALLVWPNWDFHFVRLEANGLWSSKAGNFPATTLDNAGQPIGDPRTANFSPYQFCGFFWVGPDVNILHYPQ